MAQNNQPTSSEENTPPMPVYYQPPMTHALPPPTPAGIPPAHSGEIPPPIPTSEAQAQSTSTDGPARIIALEGIEAPAMHEPAGHPANVPPPSVTLSAAIPPPPSDPTTFALPPMSIPVPAPIYAAPPPMVFPAPNPHAPAHTSEPFSFQAPPPHVSFSYLAPPPINIHTSEPGTPTQTALAAPLTNLLPETETEQEQRLKRLEENIRALQADNSHPDAGDGDWSLFPGMRLPPKIKVPEFERYDGTTDPRHYLRCYRGKMLPYWDYEEFVIHTFQDSLTGAALDWYMSLKAADILTWADLSSKFIDQYRYCAETLPTLLELSTTEMTEGQSFEAYTAKWRAAVANMSPPISEALIDAEKKLDMGIRLGRIEGPTGKKEGESSKKATVGTSFTGNKKGKDAFVNAVNPGYQAPQQFSISYTPAPSSAQPYAPPPAHHQQQHPAQQVYYSTPPPQNVHNYAPGPPLAQQNKPPASRTPQPTQRAPVP
ncbi:hypothetical protein CRG98_035333 [Punica granatum]|uniref:Retrotransposon gag domain-containing protein n=1 Tax=Punica granatum TaxID=22663 RepID=A0A2I0IJS7_PUNGR|nr:hypothetical protein CRG98_035333 [Punica granatum]